ncbi:hypothetical protein CAXC1_220061 [Candidatus Xenohaliotis californiensis]|uniref:Transposase n=1 Tax=Candidatus Xenohaliotis californiensis TaxID=84677 RepID=A0ABP0ESK4_9RICK|nr:hypothetical protein CAXC1_220061 [Candidatus Xenohaliotis californiensis]
MPRKKKVCLSLINLDRFKEELIAYFTEEEVLFLVKYLRGFANRVRDEFFRVRKPISIEAFMEIFDPVIDKSVVLCIYLSFILMILL